MRKTLKTFVFLVLLAATWLAWALLLPMKPAETKFVLLRPGWSSRHIARELKSAGVIRSSTGFLVAHYVFHPKSLKAGEYKFERAANVMEVHDRIASGDIYVHTVVIPEGLNMYDIAGAIEQAGLGPAADFLKTVRGSASLVADLDPQATSLEGYLFPDTYEFTRTQSMTDMASIMVRRFRQEAKALNLNTDVHRVVTMASIVEKETAVPEERSLVAGVYYNRLTHNIALDADPSVIYAALLNGRYQGTIHEADLQFESPYNTYRHAGLPPGPIANPGRSALQAAMHPQQTDYLYFVSDGNGHHRFARTLDEHARNVAAYRRAVSHSSH